MVYFCEGNDKQKLDWFRIINIAGERLTEQELRNAVYTGSWLSDAKLKFSKINCAAYLLAKDYVRGDVRRQDFLETAIKWISDGNIEEYMSVHQHDHNANELWLYFRNVIEWVTLTFTVYRREMKGINWGSLYNQYKDNLYNTEELENKTKELMLDDDVTSKRGIYEYLLSGDERTLNIRQFTPSMKRECYERQDGICASCNGYFEIGDMEADHVTPWSKGGKTVADNCQLLCVECNRRKGNI
jgi:hypothetical protein